MKKCELCNKEHDGLYGSGRFCSKECARSFSTKKDNEKETKITKCIVCGKKIEVNKRSDLSKSKCVDCKRNKKLGVCKICGSITRPCKRPDICKKYNLFPALIQYFGFDKNKIGNIEVYEEFERIKLLIKSEYWDNSLSLSDMVIKCGHYGVNNFQKLLISLGIERRTISDALTLAFLNGKRAVKLNIKYKHGWHTTWNNKQVFYRSSYELNYCLKLDSEKIDYEMESLRFLYWDSQHKKFRTAIPDFYIPSENKIVEIKSKYSYDEQNMKDKIIEYKKHGYYVDLIIGDINKKYTIIKTI